MLLQPIILLAQNHAGSTKLVMLGTGTPFADPDRSGPSLAVVVNETAYIVDCGPGVVRRAAAVAQKRQLPALKPDQLTRLFITHLHSDHTAGYSDFIFTPAVLDRNQPLQVIGPPGIRRMTKLLMKAYSEDMEIRIKGLEMGNADGYKVEVKEVTKGEVYRDENCVVEAFEVKHGNWRHALGYRFTTKDKVIVVSGDCTYSESLIAMARGCDILVHEVFSEAGLQKREDRWQRYHSTFHTSTGQLARIAQEVKPGLLVLTHQLTFGSSLESLLEEIGRTYVGKVVNGMDGDVF
ncbi:MAG: MBL fold metallo-hydrolase [Chitinophagaceae bacterium]|nr:MBL fold metallo-hydrolase [Chitinophagaceae bacterium]